LFLSGTGGELTNNVCAEITAGRTSVDKPIIHSLVNILV
jgi:hypothetical protein